MPTQRQDVICTTSHCGIRSMKNHMMMAYHWREEKQFATQEHTTLPISRSPVIYRIRVFKVLKCWKFWTIFSFFVIGNKPLPEPMRTGFTDAYMWYYGRWVKEVFFTDPSHRAWFIMTPLRWSDGLYIYVYIYIYILFTRGPFYTSRNWPNTMINRAWIRDYIHGRRKWGVITHPCLISTAGSVDSRWNWDIDE